MRGQYIPVYAVNDRSLGNYLMADWLGASYNDFLGLLQIQEQYILQPADVPTPDLLSYKFYETTDYWWILCMWNGCIDIFTDMQPGLTWKIPTYQSIQAMLSGALNAAAGGTNQIGQVVSI